MTGPLNSMLVATDFSKDARAAIGRAAVLARDTGARVTLVHVLPASLPSQLHVQAAAQANVALASLCAEMKQAGVLFEPLLLSGAVADRLAEAGAHHDVLVAGAHGEDLFLDFAMGRTSERLIRKSRRPVLIVKRPPDGIYEKVVAATDFSAPSVTAARLASVLAPRSTLNLVHGFEVEFESTLRLAGVEEEVVHAYRRAAREQALQEMNRLIETLALPQDRIWRSVVHGYPPRVVLECEEDMGAQLVAVGKHAAGRIEELLIGSVALQILEKARCDVLVVPS